MDLYRIFPLTDLSGHAAFYALIAVVVVAGLIWGFSAHNSSVHKTSASILICAAMAGFLLIFVSAIETLM
jgi:hypothetical protein